MVRYQVEIDGKTFTIIAPKGRRSSGADCARTSGAVVGNAQRRAASQDQEAWQEAIDNDKRAVSEYAEKSIEEDFAESTRVYNLTKGTPPETKARERFPARYAELDRWAGGVDAQ